MLFFFLFRVFLSIWSTTCCFYIPSDPFFFSLLVIVVPPRVGANQSLKKPLHTPKNKRGGIGMCVLLPSGGENMLSTGGNNSVEKISFFSCCVFLSPPSILLSYSAQFGIASSQGRQVINIVTRSSFRLSLHEANDRSVQEAQQQQPPSPPQLTRLH